jgi:hypothetical protein
MRRLPDGREPTLILSATETRSGRIREHIWLLPGIQTDNHRSGRRKHLSTSRYSSYQRDVSGTRTTWLATLSLKSAVKEEFEKFS